MKIERKDVPVSTIQAFADKHDLVMEVYERGKGTSSNMRYWANFKGAEVKDGPILSGATGNGPTPEAAIADYAIKISGELLVIDAYRPTRREISVPRLISDRAFNEYVKGVEP